MKHLSRLLVKARNYNKHYLVLPNEDWWFKKPVRKRLLSIGMYIAWGDEIRKGNLCSE